MPLNMEGNKVHFRHLMLFLYWKGRNATQAANKICAVYGEGAVAERTVRKWFARFKAGDFNLKDQERPGRPSTTDEDQIETLIENNPRYTTCRLAEMLRMYWTYNLGQKYMKLELLEYPLFTHSKSRCKKLER
ncbi:PREDICTED: histone-lysine N-methyltransferase SETMAR-like isoform X2 [Vollenhovia emeryi]|uniref:histone-lysine N-methyltransferase SETMAR-like isoform X1 n=1 Tax=Vollenhovia emeryi TaxID=411798 RepID=UPI0005F483F2|nr:PREDICTED: histone-lysine N-methyltransferase SETMAR-like isoform X1 [Vollenhovia emeryi]XP_011859835.1 PREDICTED: histone-lysine N-methyltransferase SETMAR-like isoform X2 [Vollenhovia emeryi]